MNWLSILHGRVLAPYRLRALIDLIAELIPADASVLDVGCGNGALAAGIAALRPDVHVEGIDLDRVTGSAIRIHKYNGIDIPFPSNSWDICMASDVLHHCDDPRATLSEMCRVAKSALIVKDHVADTWHDRKLLEAMDWVGNRGYGTPLPYNFLTSREWSLLFDDLHVSEKYRATRLGLYPKFFLGFLDRQLHFLTYLELNARRGSQSAV